MIEFTRADLPECSVADPNDWVATCGVCEGGFVVPGIVQETNPAPSGSFCPDCRSTHLNAPGVLHWKKRASSLTSPHEPGAT